MAKIGLVPMSAKPYHAGHDGLVRIAAKENDEVHLYVSTSDRDEVSGAAMERIWKECIEPTLPGNVRTIYGGSPVGNVIKEVGDANEKGSTDTFSVYSDPEDIKKFSVLSKYAGNLMAQHQIILRGIERSSTVDVSGTQMRQWLVAGDKASFVAHLPRALDGERVWNILTTMKPEPKKAKAAGAKKTPAAKEVKAEGMLRSLVRLHVGR